MINSTTEHTMRTGSLHATFLNKRANESLEEFIVSVESILGSLGAEIVMSIGKNSRLYQISGKGGIIGQFGEPNHIKARNKEFDVNALIGYLGMPLNTELLINSAFDRAGYQVIP